MRRYWAIVALLVAAILVVTLAITYGLLRLGRSPQPAPEPVAEASPSPSVATPQTKRMLVAARYLAVGTLLGEADVVSEPLEVGRIPAGAIPESDDDEIPGTAVRVPIDAGTPVLFTDLVHPGARGFLSLILSPGMRAVSVKIEPETRFAGLVDPGDRVDVIFTASAPPTDHLLDVDVNSSGEGPLSRVLFEDLRVLAIDRTVRPPAVGGEEPPDQRQEIATATLEVSPAQAPALIHASREGELALVARSAMPAPVPPPPPVAVHIRELLLPGARQAVPVEADPISTEVDPTMLPSRVVRVFRAGSGTEAHVEFFDHGPPHTEFLDSGPPRGEIPAGTGAPPPLPEPLP